MEHYETYGAGYPAAGLFRRVKTARIHRMETIFNFPCCIRPVCNNGTINIK